MLRLAVLTPKEVLKILEKNGFGLDHVTGSHYVLFNQSTSKRVVVPFHTKDLPKGTLLSIIKLSGLTKKDFL